MTHEPTAPAFPALSEPAAFITYSLVGSGLVVSVSAEMSADVAGLVPDDTLEGTWERFTQLFGRAFPADLGDRLRSAVQTAVTAELQAAVQEAAERAFQEARRPVSARAFRARLRRARRGADRKVVNVAA